MTVYIKILERVGSEDVTEVPLEDDGTLPLETLTSSFPNAVGLKAKVSEKSTRAVRSVGGVLHPLDASDDPDIVFAVVLQQSSKRGREEDQHSRDAMPAAKQTPKLEVIVLGLPFSETDEAIKEYFNDFGEVESVDVKKFPDGKSRGFAFVVFKDANVAQSVTAVEHTMGGRSLEVKFPYDRTQRNENQNYIQGAPRGGPEIKKIFIGKVTLDLTDAVLREHFSQFGELSDVYVPMNPFRGIAYVEFKQVESMEKALATTNEVEGVELNCQKAIPKQQRGNFSGQFPPRGGFNGGRGNYNGGGYGNQGVYNQGNYGRGGGYNGGSGNFNPNQGGSQGNGGEWSGNNGSHQNQNGDVWNSGGGRNNNNNNWSGGYNNQGNQQGYQNQGGYNNNHGGYGNQQGANYGGNY